MTVDASKDSWKWDHLFIAVGSAEKYSQPLYQYGFLRKLCIGFPQESATPLLESSRSILCLTMEILTHPCPLLFYLW